MIDHIRTLLAEAHELDAAARERRRDAGRILAELLHQTPALEWRRTCAALGFDTRTADILIRQATGREAA